MKDNFPNDSDNVTFHMENLSVQDIILGIIPQDKNGHNDRLEDFKCWAVLQGYNPDFITVTDEFYYIDQPKYAYLHERTKTANTRLALVSIADVMYANQKLLSQHKPISDIISDIKPYILSADSTRILEVSAHTLGSEKLCVNSNMAKARDLNQFISQYNTATITENELDLEIDKLNNKQFSQLMDEIQQNRNEIMFATPKQVNKWEDFRRDEIPLDVVLNKKMTIAEQKLKTNKDFLFIE